MPEQDAPKVFKRASARTRYYGLPTLRLRSFRPHLQRSTHIYIYIRWTLRGSNHFIERKRRLEASGTTSVPLWHRQVVVMHVVDTALIPPYLHIEALSKYSASLNLSILCKTAASANKPRSEEVSAIRKEEVHPSHAPLGKPEGISLQQAMATAVNRSTHDHPRAQRTKELQTSNTF